MALDAWIKELAEPQHKNYLLATVLDGPEQGAQVLLGDGERLCTEAGSNGTTEFLLQNLPQLRRCTTSGTGSRRSSAGTTSGCPRGGP